MFSPHSTQSMYVSTVCQMFMGLRGFLSITSSVRAQNPIGKFHARGCSQRCFVVGCDKNVSIAPCTRPKHDRSRPIPRLVSRASRTLAKRVWRLKQDNWKYTPRPTYNNSSQRPETYHTRVLAGSSSFFRRPPSTVSRQTPADGFYRVFSVRCPFGPSEPR